MGRSTRPRKAYRPAPLRADAFLHAIDRVATLLPHQVSSLADPVRAALADFRVGRGSAEHWCTLADALNVAEALAAIGIGGGIEERIAAGQAALAAVHARQQQRHSWTLRAPELGALDEAAFWAVWQLGQCSQGELHDAVQRVKRRTAAALAGSVGAGTIVCAGHLGRDGVGA